MRVRDELHGEGRMTTEHAASSYGLPVAVFEDGACGPAECGALVALDDDTDMIERARKAGYTVETRKGGRG